MRLSTDRGRGREREEERKREKEKEGERERERESHLISEKMTVCHLLRQSFDKKRFILFQLSPTINRMSLDPKSSFFLVKNISDENNEMMVKGKNAF